MECKDDGFLAKTRYLPYSTRVAAKSGELTTIGLDTRLIAKRAQKRQSLKEPRRGSCPRSLLSSASTLVFGWEERADAPQVHVNVYRACKFVYLQVHLCVSMYIDHLSMICSTSVAWAQLSAGRPGQLEFRCTSADPALVFTIPFSNPASSCVRSTYANALTLFHISQIPLLSSRLICFFYLFFVFGLTQYGFPYIHRNLLAAILLSLQIPCIPHILVPFVKDSQCPLFSPNSPTMDLVQTTNGYVHPYSPGSPRKAWSCGKTCAQ